MTLMYRVRVSSSGWSGGPGLNTFYFEPAPDATVATSTGAQACVDSVQGALIASRELFPSLTTLIVEPVVDVLTAATGQLTTSFGTIPNVPIIGAGSANYGPTAVMICGSLLTTTVINGHRVRGRAFFGPLPQYADANGSPVAGPLGQVKSILENVHPSETTVGKLVVWHRPKLGLGGAAAPVTSVFVRDKFAVLRSRRD